MVTEHDVRVIESGKADVEPNDYEEMLKARIPLSNNPRKASYLAYRASGFGVRESCVLANISFVTVKKWRREDQEFREWETGEKLAWLQHRVVHDLERMEFMRNFRLLMRLDGKVLYKANYNLESLSEIERHLLRSMGKHYTPQALITMDRALQPDDGSLPPGSYRESVTVTVEGRAVEDENARRAASRELLDRFKTNQKQVEELPRLTDGEKPLTGEVLSGNGDSS